MMFLVTAHSALVVIRNRYMEVLACGFAPQRGWQKTFFLVPCPSEKTMNDVTPLRIWWETFFEDLAPLRSWWIIFLPLGLIANEDFPAALYTMVPCVCMVWSTVFVYYGPMCLYAMVHCVCILGPTTVIRVVNMNLAILPYQGIAINQYQLYWLNFVISNYSLQYNYGRGWFMPTVYGRGAESCLQCMVGAESVWEGRWVTPSVMRKEVKK